MEAQTQKKPKVSVCLPICNGAKFLQAAIESVLAQTFSDYELVIVDDCSDDQSKEIAHRLSRKDPRVRVYENISRLGLFANYNKSMTLSRGEYIKLFAQDDLLEPTCLEKMLVSFERQQGIGLVSCARKIINEDKTTLSTEHFYDTDQLIPGEQVIVNYFETFVDHVGTPTQVMLKRELVGTGFDTRYVLSGDIAYWLAILKNCDFLYLNELLCSFRRHPASETTTVLKNMSFVDDPFVLLSEFAPFLKGLDREKLLKRLFKGLTRKINHALHVRKLQMNSDSIESKVFFDQCALHTEDHYKTVLRRALLYAAELEMRLDQSALELEHLKASQAASVEGNRAKIVQLSESLQESQDRLENILNSRTWRLTKFLRQFKVKEPQL